jgi:hypothetical protein
MKQRLLYLKKNKLSVWIELKSQYKQGFHLFLKDGIHLFQVPVILWLL